MSIVVVEVEVVAVVVYLKKLLTKYYLGFIIVIALILPGIVVVGIEVFEQLQKSLRIANATVSHVSIQSGFEKHTIPFPKYPFLHWQE